MKSPLELAAAQLADEHEQLLDMVNRSYSIDDDFDFASYLKDLHSLLVDHFTHEQLPGGLYESIKSLGTEHHTEVIALIKQHYEILSDVQELLDRAKPPNAGEPKDLHSGIKSIVATLNQHEQREHRLTYKLLAPKLAAAQNAARLFE